MSQRRSSKFTVKSHQNQQSKTKLADILDKETDEGLTEMPREYQK